MLSQVLGLIGLDLKRKMREVILTTGLALLGAILILLGATAFVAVLSDFLVGTIEHVRASFGVTEIFVGVIVVAVIGNAAEHSTAILMALKNKMDLSVGIAIGSSLQIALFVAPALVLLSYVVGPTPMDLQFWPGAVTMVMIATVTRVRRKTASMISPWV